MDASVKAFFERYERLFNQTLAGGNTDMDALAALYAPEFIASSPLGVASGRNDEDFRQAMARGYEHYRQIGTRGMRIRDVRISPIDEEHCLAHVAWTATYARKDGSETAIDFEVHYLVRTPGGEPEVFGWVSGDEQALLRQHGIV